MMSDNKDSSMLPPPSDDTDVRRALASIKRAQSKQALVESERTGASKLVAKLVTLFGAIITASAIACFVWVWQAHASIQTHDSKIVQISGEHASLTASSAATQRRVAHIESVQQSLIERLDREERARTLRHQELLTEIRRVRVNRWGR